jgi:hypothetical protein
MAYKRQSPIPVNEGGTGAQTLTDHGVLLGNTTSAITATSAGTDGQLLISATAGAPAFATVTAGANITLTPGANSLTIAANATSQVVGYVNTSTTPYVVAASDYFISMNSTGAIKTVQLPNAPSTGRVFVVKDFAGTAAAFNITVTTVGGVVNIDGATTFVMNSAYQSVNVIFNGTSYEIY